MTGWETANEFVALWGMEPTVAFEPDALVADRYEIPSLIEVTGQFCRECAETGTPVDYFSTGVREWDRTVNAEVRRERSEAIIFAVATELVAVIERTDGAR